MWTRPIKYTSFKGYQRDTASVWCSGRPLALQAKRRYFNDNTSHSLSPLWYQSLTLNKTIKIMHYSLHCTTATFPLSSIPSQFFSSTVQYAKTRCSVGCFLFEVPTKQERRLCAVAAWFVLLRLQCVMLGNREDLKGWLAAEQPEKAWRQAQRFPVAAFATLS